MTDAPNRRSKYVRWAIEGSHYRGTTYAVFVVLAERANEQGLCWPSLADIELDTRSSRRTVQYAVARLEQDGWIRIHRQRGRNGANLYQLNLKKMEHAYTIAHARRQQRHVEPPPPMHFLEPAVETELPAIAAQKPRTTGIRFSQDQETCGKPEDKTIKTVEIPLKTSENRSIPGDKGCNPLHFKSATTAPQGCNPLHPNPQEPPGNPKATTKAKACYYGGNGSTSGRDPPLAQ